MKAEPSTRSSHGFDVVLGNPPFLNQLESATVAQRGPAAMLQVLTNGAIRGYTDLSATFLLQSTRMCRRGGRLALVQPQSLLAAKDAGAVRSAVLDDASLTQLWVSNEHVFAGASVFTCAPTLHRSGPRTGTLSRISTGAFTPLPTIELDSDKLRSEETWAHLAAAALGIPEFEYSSGGVIGDLATATADFRDQYYGLEGFLLEDAGVNRTERDREIHFPPIITTGLVDLALSYWSIKQTRILKQPWTAPRIDRDRMRAEGTLSEWISSRLIPKIVLATQTKVLEAFVDEQGRYVPSLPLITIAPINGADLWRIAAAIASPVCAGIAMQKYSGAALSVQAIKLSAKQTLALPIPKDGADWDHAAALLKEAHALADDGARSQRLIDYARASIAAFGVPAEQSVALLDWWVGRFGTTTEPEEDSDAE